MTRSKSKLEFWPSRIDVRWRKSRVVPTVISWELFPDGKKGNLWEQEVAAVYDEAANKA